MVVRVAYLACNIVDLLTNYHSAANVDYGWFYANGFSAFFLSVRKVDSARTGIKIFNRSGIQYVEKQK